MSNGSILGNVSVYIVSFRYVGQLFAEDVCIVAGSMERAAAMAESYMAQEARLTGHRIESIRRVEADGNVLIDPFVPKDSE